MTLSDRGQIFRTNQSESP